MYISAHVRPNTGPYSEQSHSKRVRLSLEVKDEKLDQLMQQQQKDIPAILSTCSKLADNVLLQKPSTCKELFHVCFTEKLFTPHHLLSSDIDQLLTRVVNTINLDDSFSIERYDYLFTGTPLMHAARHGDIACVQWLLSKNANPYQKTDNQFLSDIDTFNDIWDEINQKLLAIESNSSIGELYIPSAIQRLHQLKQDFASEITNWYASTSALSCAMQSTHSPETQQLIIQNIFQTMVTIDPNNVFVKAINRFREEGEMCAISHEKAQEPMLLLETAQIYDGTSINTWFNQRKTCPRTALPLQSLTLVPLNWFSNVLETANLT